MLRRALLGAAVMGALSALAGYVWVAFEFPFAIVLPAIIGMLAVLLPSYPSGKAWLASIVGGIGFTVAFMVALFLALTDGSPVAIPGWLAALAAASVAGAVVGALLEGRSGSLVLGGFSAAGMVLGLGVMAAMRYLAPASVDVEGVAQIVYFSAAIGLVGLAMGAFFGAGVDRIQQLRKPT